MPRSTRVSCASELLVVFRSLARGGTRRVSCVKLLYAKDQFTWCFQHEKVAGAPFEGSGICCGATLRCGVPSLLWHVADTAPAQGTTRQVL